MADFSKTAIALGSFDGLHKGHKSVIACALSLKERGFVPVILLFDSHPLLTLTGKAPGEILGRELKEEMLKSTGINIEYISFKEIKDYTPEEFFNKIIVERFGGGALCCGSNYRFGKNGSGTVETLRSLCSEKGLLLEVCPDVMQGGEIISSTRIRESLAAGNIKQANEMLGYSFRYRFTVVHGSERGRRMGFPTANQNFDEGFIIPRPGVYASFALVDGKPLPAVTSIGCRPTFGGEEVRSETHIPGCFRDLYGEMLEIRLIDRIRDEKAFSGESELASQIKSDIDRALIILENEGKENV